MSDSSFYAVDRKTRALLDVVDEAWEQDCLSDDDIVVPKELAGNAPQMDESEEEEENGETWNDLGVDRMASVEPKAHKPNDRKTALVLPHQAFPQS